MRPVLYLVNQLPFPPHSGGQLRAAELIRRVSKDFEVHLVAVSEHEPRASSVTAAFEQGCSSVTAIAASATRPRAAPPGVPERVWAYDAADAPQRIRSLLRHIQPALVHIEGYFLMHHLRLAPEIPTFLVEQNVEYLLVEQREALGESRGASWQATREAEHAAWRAARLCGAVTDEDAERMRADIPGLEVRCVPNGWDHDIGLSPERPSGEDGPPVIAFTASYDWAPSRDAAVVLLEDLWPRIHRAEPEATLLMAGSGADEGLRRLASREGVHFAGEVAALGPYLQRASVFLCPLRYGGGVKVKVVEAMRAGCAVVTTPVGVQGLPARLLSAIVVRADWTELSTATIDLLRNPKRLQLLRARAREAGVGLPTWDRSADLLLDAWKDAMSRRTP